MRKGPKGGVELYNLAEDVGEKNDLSAAKPGLVKRALELMEQSRTADPAWPIPGRMAVISRSPPFRKGRVWGGSGRGPATQFERGEQGGEASARES